MGSMSAGSVSIHSDNSSSTSEEYGRPKAGKDEPATEKSSESSGSPTSRCRIAFGRLCGNSHEFFQDTSFRLKYSRRDRVAYFLDRILAKRSRFFILLGIWGLLQVICAGVCYSLVWSGRLEDDDPRDENQVWPITESIWEAWTFMADPGTHAKVYMTSERLMAGMITLSGILFFASILGVTVDMIREKMESLRQGKSRIIESNHTLILGWTEKTIHIVEELCKANESEGGGIVAILAPENKGQMELELELQLPLRQRRGTRVIFRSGSPLVMGDLLRVSVHLARAVIILSAPGSADQADADVLRTMLSLRSLYDQLQGHVIAEVQDIDNEPLVKLVGGPRVETLVSHDVIGRLMLMSVRQPGLAKVYEALLGFSGDEFYMAEWPELVGRSFGDLLRCFPDAIPVGVFSSEGYLTLRPASDLEIQEGDNIIVIAEDNDTYKPENPREIEAGVPPKEIRQKHKQEKILFCGWRRDIRDILQQLDRIVQKGSEVHMMTHCVPLEMRTARLMEDGLDVDRLENLVIVHFYGNTSVRRKLEGLPIESYSSCMIFADEAFESDTLHADSHSLATLLLIRDIQSARSSGVGSMAASPTSRISGRVSVSSSEGKAAGLARSIVDLSHGERCPIICEVLDPHTQKTIANNRHLSLTSDFCQTNKLIAQVLAMVAEDRTVNLIFDELLGNAGCNMAVVPSTRYAHEGERVSFWVLAQRAQSLGELLVGYQMRNSIDKTVLNPPQKDKGFIWDRYDLAIIRGEVKVSRASTDAVRNSVQGFVSLEQRTAIKDLSRDIFMSGGGLRGSIVELSAVQEGYISESSMTSGSKEHHNQDYEAIVPDMGSLHTRTSMASDTSSSGIAAAGSDSLNNWKSGPSPQTSLTQDRRHEELAQRLGGFLDACSRLGPVERQELSGLLGTLAEAVVTPSPAAAKPVFESSTEVGPPLRASAVERGQPSRTPQPREQLPGSMRTEDTCTDQLMGVLTPAEETGKALSSGEGEPSARLSTPTPGIPPNAQPKPFQHPPSKDCLTELGS